MDTKEHARESGLRLEEAWRRIGCRKTKLYDLINSGELTTYYVGRRRCVTASSVDAFIKRATEQARNQTAA